MNFNRHSNLEGAHAFLSASKYSWLNYDEEQLSEAYFRFLAVQKGTELHELAKRLIKLGVKLPRKKETLNLYVNDAIGFRMTPEQPLYYSPNSFGTADAISFRKDLLRIHDLKTGTTPAKMKQLEVYSALFCLEYGMKPNNIGIELRIYQNDEVLIHEPDSIVIADANEVKAFTIDAVAAKIATLKAQDIETDSLAAALAAFTVVTAGTAEFDKATVQHLVAAALNLEFGTAEEVFIQNLRVAYGQMVQATIGNLMIKASDGNYYRIDVDADGNVSAVLSTVTEDEIEAGITEDQRVILATDITADSLSTSNLLATYALINKIDAAEIDVDQLFAREAFINKLSTSIITNDTNIQMLIGKYGELSKWFIFDDEDGFTIKKPAYTDASGVAHPESIWRFRATETGIQIIRSDMPTEPVLSAEREQITTPSMQIGEILCKRTSSGGWVWTDE